MMKFPITTVILWCRYFHQIVRSSHHLKLLEFFTTLKAVTVLRSYVIVSDWSRSTLIYIPWKLTMILNAMTLVPGKTLVPINFRSLKVMDTTLLSRKWSDNQLKMFAFLNVHILRCKRMEKTISEDGLIRSSLPMVQYSFKNGVERPLKPKSHGNSKQIPGRSTILERGKVQKSA